MPVKSANKTATPQIAPLEGMTPLGLKDEKDPKMNLPELGKKKEATKPAVKPSAQAKSTLKYQLIPFDKLEPNLKNMRQDYGNLQPLMYEIIKNISSIDPIRVFPAQEDGQYLIDRGHRRYKAISDAVKKGLLLKTIAVPCIVDDQLTEEKQLIGQLSSNAGKKYTGLEMFGVIEALVKLGKKHDQISELIPSVSGKLIKLNVALATFHDRWLRSAVELEILSLSCAMKIAYLDDMIETQPLWTELKKWLTVEYETILKKIPEKMVFDKIDELRNGKENEREPVKKRQVPEKIAESLFRAQDTGTIDVLTLDWVLKELGIIED